MPQNLIQLLKTLVNIGIISTNEAIETTKLALEVIDIFIERQNENRYIEIKSISNIYDVGKNNLANNIKNITHNLDIYNNPSDMNTYENERFRWFDGIEGGSYPESYDDLASGRSNDPKKISERVKLGLNIKGKVTIGIGFNMDANGKDAWNKAFYDKNTRPNFDDVYMGRVKLKDSEVRQLFDYSIKERETRLQKLFGEDWKKFKPNERLAIEDKYFQSNNINSIKNDLKTNKHFRWIWHGSNAKNPNEYHRDVLNGNVYQIGSKEWKWMTSNRLKGCHCSYEIID